MNKPFFTPEPRIIAHRGSSGDFPENTHLAFKKSVEIGVDVLETDVHYTKDGDFIVIHDPDLERVSDGSGCVADHSLKELKQFDAGYHFSPDGGASFPFRGKNLRFLSLEDMLEEFPSQRFNIDLKTRNPVQVTRYLEIIKKMNAQDRILTASEYGPNTTAVRRAMPEMATSFALWPALRYLFLYRSGLLFFRKKFPQDALQIPEYYGPSHIVTSSFVKQAHKVGLRIHVWTVNEEKDMRRLFEAGVDAIVSDYPELLKSVAKDYF